MSAKRKLEFKEEALQDIVAAAGWYREQQAELDKKFLSAIKETTDRILRHPDSGAKIYKHLRQAIVKRFPYIIIYQVTGNTIIIFQVFNSWRNPDKKRRTNKPRD